MIHLFDCIATVFVTTLAKSFVNSLRETGKMFSARRVCAGIFKKIVHLKMLFYLFFALMRGPEQKLWSVNRFLNMFCPCNVRQQYSDSGRIQATVMVSNAIFVCMPFATFTLQT